MRGKNVVISMLLMSLVGATMLPSARATDQAAAAKAASSAAEDWLKLVDQGDYQASYAQASRVSQSAVSAEQWSQGIGAGRKLLGAVISRQQKSATYATSLPGAPDGQYVVIKYDTSFEKKKSAVETVTPMMDSDGHWRVSGYFIK